jgi:hypothetical protein
MIDLGGGAKPICTPFPYGSVKHTFSDFHLYPRRGRTQEEHVFKFFIYMSIYVFVTVYRKEGQLGYRCQVYPKCTRTRGTDGKPEEGPRQFKNAIRQM